MITSRMASCWMESLMGITRWRRPITIRFISEGSICLYTHMPVTDFPEEERGRLMDGIWFSSMIEVFNYLESYTS